jgi:putative peptidoglycan lipid II flippase
MGGLLQLVLQIPWILKKGLSLLPCWVPNHPAVKRIGLLMLPAIFGSAIYQFSQFIGTLLASFLVEGSVSWLYYADRLVQFPLGVFAIAISTAALPSLSRHVAGQELDEFRETLSHSLRLVFFISIPSMAGLIILGKPIIQVFFERGDFDTFSTLMTTQALICYSLGLWAFSGLRVTVSAFYAFQDTKTPVKVACVALIAYLIFSLSLMGPLKHGGLALALSLSSTLQLFLLVFLLKRKMDTWDLEPILKSIGKCIIASMVMGFGIHYLYSNWLIPNPALGLWYLVTNLASLILIGVIIYFVVAKILGCQELRSVLDIFKPFVKRAKS